MKRQTASAILLVAGIFAGFAAPSAFAQRPDDESRETERVDRTVPLGPGGTLRLKNFSGDVRITAGGAGQVVIAAVRRATRERLNAIKLDIQSSGSEVTIEANRRESWWREKNNNVVETDFDIAVPADTRLDIDVFSSNVRVTDVRGRQRIHTFSGPILVRGAADSLELETFSADVDLQVSDATGQPDLEVKTFSGNIVAEVPEATAGVVRFHSFSGDLKTDLPLTLERSGKRDVRGRLNDGGASDLYFKTFSGDVRLRKN